VDDRILLLNYDGTLVLVQCNPKAYTELARAKVLTGTIYNHPAICDGRVYARSTYEAVCLDLAEKITAPVKLALPSRQPKDYFELLVGDALGNGLSTQRIPQIDLLATTNLNLPVANWIKLTNAVVTTNGILQLDDSNSTRLPQRFFLGIERP
jgi:hypothetical protein